MRQSSIPVVILITVLRVMTTGAVQSSEVRIISSSTHPQLQGATNMVCARIDTGVVQFVDSSFILDP